MNVFHKLLGLLFFVLGVWSARQNRERLAHRLPFVLIVLVESALSFFLLAFSVKDEADLIIYYVAFGTFLFLAPQAVPYVVSLFYEKPASPPEEVTSPPPPQPAPEPVFTIPEHARFMHTLVLGGTGSGKTSLLSDFIAKDLFSPCSLVVFDSQGDLIHRVMRVDVPKERIVIIDPTDIEHPIGLSLFDIGRSDNQTDFEKERHLNATVELITYVLDYMGAPLTSKQDVALRFVIRLCLVIPEATIHTLRDILTTNGFTQYAEHTASLSETARSFFLNEFQSRQFAETREQLLRRVYGICENQTLERMFSSTTSKLNMADLLNNGSVILINTAKSFLKEEGSSFFSRFMVALISQAVNERDPAKEMMPAFCYIDEAAPTLANDNGVVSGLLETSRKYNFGLTLAFQTLSQIPSDIQQSVIANTATKCLSGVSAKDARALADDVGSSAESLMALPRLTFLISVKNHGRTTRRIEPGALDRLPKRKDMRELLARNRTLFAAEKAKKKPPSPHDDIEGFNRT